MQEELDRVERGEPGSNRFTVLGAALHPELSSTPVGFKPCEVEPPPKHVGDVERSIYRVEWERAMKSELDGRIETGTFSLVDRVPEGRKPVSSKWCFDYKTDASEEITKLKARLVARGFSQIKDVDYVHSSSPCPSAASIKLILAVANEKSLPLRHFDVAQAYIRASLEEEVFMKLPAGCGVHSKKNAKLGRAIYGLKQSGRQWGYLCADTLIENGFEQCRADPCIFRKIVDGVVVMIVGVYVDDLLVGGSKEDCDSLLKSLNQKFPTKDLGECTWYDGCGIERDLSAGKIRLSQQAYIGHILKRFDIRKTSDIPASPGADLGPRRDDEAEGDWPVREAIGSLMWLSTMTRPDITNAVRAVARCAHAPSQRLWSGVMKILEYLNGSRELAITFERGGGLELNAFVDANYASAETNRRSVSGIAIMLGKAVVSHASKTQRVVATSTSEAEYIAATEGVKEALFARAVLSFVAPETSGASIRIFEDNQGAKALIENPLSSGRSKHIDVRFHFIRDMFRQKKIAVDYVKSEDQHADILTKALSKSIFESHRKYLMNLAG